MDDLHACYVAGQLTNYHLERACRHYWGSTESTFVQNMGTGLRYYGLILHDGTWVYVCSWNLVYILPLMTIITKGESK